MLKQFRQKLNTARHLSGWEKGWFVKLYFMSGLIRLITVIFPFQRVSRYLGNYHRNFQVSTLVSEEQLVTANQFKKIIQLVCRYTPWHCHCLVQAIIAAYFFKHYEIPYVLYLGAKLNRGQDKLKAHAWLMIKNQIITGKQGYKAYRIVGCYLSPLIVAA
ncbi:lasso peptide biosynthesis B2 protein [Aliikangiella maris]|uniref:Lasso peptide biosynthesis B2 protein n=2 Tax=Aliikangiella maris TaxID=3162458 RepID=A0ABV2BT88_9GAMM